MRWVLLLLIAGASPAFSSEPDGGKRAVELALPYLEKEGTWWIEKKKCASCHHSTFFVWAKDLALDSGFPVDGEVLGKQRRWVLESLLKPVEPDPKKPDEKVKPGTVVGDRNVEGVSQLLVSASSKAISDGEMKALRAIIVKNQNEEGDWTPGGQLPRQERPAAETQWVSNQWATWALGDEGAAGIPQVDPGEGESTGSTEWFALKVIASGSEESVRQLLARQNEDGGWSWIEGEPSGPIGTGQALLALAHADVLGKHGGAVKKARDYLIRTQDEEGCWETMSTKDLSESTDISDFWGTCWAVIGLLESDKKEAR